MISFLNHSKTTAIQYLNRLGAKWGLESLLQVTLVLVVFSLAGSSVVLLRKGFFQLIGYDQATAFWLKAVTYILFMVPAYQMLLLVYGFILGQFDFFWKKEKQLAIRIKRLFYGKQ